MTSLMSQLALLVVSHFIVELCHRSSNLVNVSTDKETVHYFLRLRGHMFGWQSSDEWRLGSNFINVLRTPTINSLGKCPGQPVVVRLVT